MLPKWIILPRCAQSIIDIASTSTLGNSRKSLGISDNQMQNDKQVTDGTSEGFVTKNGWYLFHSDMGQISLEMHA